MRSNVCALGFFFHFDKIEKMLGGIRVIIAVEGSGALSMPKCL